MPNKTKIIVKSSFFTTLAMICYFFFLRGIQLDEVPALRIVNFLFIFTGVNYAIEKNIYVNYETQYWKNFWVGIYTSLLTVVLAICTLLMYINYVQPSFIVILQHHFFFWEHQFSLPIIFLIIVLQGLIISIISTFLILQIHRKKNT